MARLSQARPCELIDLRQGPREHTCSGSWVYAGLNAGGHEIYRCDSGRHDAIGPHVNAAHECEPQCSHRFRAGESVTVAHSPLTGTITGLRLAGSLPMYLVTLDGHVAGTGAWYGASELEKELARGDPSYCLAGSAGISHVSA